MTMLYLKNGDVYMGDHYTTKEAKRMLKEKGYKTYYIGKEYLNNQSCVVGIDKNNTVGIAQRRKNGFLWAREYSL